MDQRTDDQLRQKISSKMTVATFLAGFNFTALTLVLTTDANDGFDQTVLDVAGILFFAATGLFVAAVYAYDGLMMPTAFYSPRASRAPRALHIIDWHLARRGFAPGLPELFRYMMLAWLALFIPATALSTLGIMLVFLALVPEKAFVATAAILALAIGYAQLLKPRLSID